MKTYIRRIGNITDAGSPIQMECECGNLVFETLHDVSTENSTARWVKCLDCGIMYDVRINKITQEYIKEIET